ncbi:hypothetical protein BgAZ_303940 [Babesia gibsoni]|uniref:Uncharacterized protein n=1 Tax=Babesia gibsoni TaxID=33632 RepID=A0AAD8PDY6_BABGI|nr:hypothetical protein BgAZ_303940 [Babesia gibsoni]
MDNLFEEDGLPYSEEEPEPANSSVPNDRDAISRLTFNLRRCGVNQRLRNDILEELLERLTNSPSRLLCLDDTLEVDEFLWNLTVVLLQQDPNCENIVNVLENWSIHKKKANLEKTKTGNHDEIYIYNVTKDIPSIVYCKNKKKFSREFIQGATTLVSEIRYQLVLEKTKAVHPDVLPVDAISRVTKGEQVLVGVIGLDKKGELCLQGFLSELRMILDDATVLQSGIYCEGSTVIVRCLVEPYKDAIRCIEVTHPPMHVDIELPDFFGGRLTHNDHRVLEMAMAQKVKAGISEQWIIISDVHLDNDATIKMLEDVFNSTFNDSK